MMCPRCGSDNSRIFNTTVDGVVRPITVKSEETFLQNSQTGELPLGNDYIKCELNLYMCDNCDKPFALVNKISIKLDGEIINLDGNRPIKGQSIVQL